MTDLNKWKNALSPNYETNVDKLYPYSELPYERDYAVIKIPICTEDLIEHVDYFGEGRADTSKGTVGFSNCYNVNYQYTLVQEGPDAGRKIPNRIPISPDTEETRKYIKDNSVITVTVSVPNFDLTKAVAQDIARIVNGRKGKVIIYGDYKDSENELIKEELKIEKQLIYCPIYTLPDNLKLTFCNTLYKGFLSMNEMKNQLYRNIVKSNIEAAVILTECLNNSYSGNAIRDVVTKLITNKISSVIVYAYKLWNNNSKDVVSKHFPKVFQQIFNGDCMVIVNKQNNQALVLEPSTKLARCDSQSKSTKTLVWKIIPEWDDSEANVVFKPYNVDANMFLNMSSGDGDGVKGEARASQDQADKFILEPSMINGQVAFTIYSCEQDKSLELPVDIDSAGDNAVLWQKAAANEDYDRARWILAACDKKDSDSLSEVDDDSD